MIVSNQLSLWFVRSFSTTFVILEFDWFVISVLNAIWLKFVALQLNVALIKLGPMWSGIYSNCIKNTSIIVKNTWSKNLRFYIKGMKVGPLYNLKQNVSKFYCYPLLSPIYILQQLEKKSLLFVHSSSQGAASVPHLYFIPHPLPTISPVMKDNLSSLAYLFSFTLPISRILYNSGSWTLVCLRIVWKAC